MALEAGHIEVFRTPDNVTQLAAQRVGEYLKTLQDPSGKQVLRERQASVMEDIYKFLQTHDEDPHGYISLPTGVGKTVLFTELVKATGLRTLVLTPTRLLLGQTEEAFGRFGEDDIAIGKVFSTEKNDNEQITLTTYASFVRHTKDEDSPYINPGQYDMIILDEAHRALATETRKALAHYRNAVQIGFTATENYSDRRKLQNLLSNEIHKMSIKEAVQSELIAPFTNVVVETDVDVSSVKLTSSNEYDIADLERALNTEHRNELALEVYKKYFQGKKTIVFCNGVAHAVAVADLFSASGVNTAAIHGSLSVDIQAAIKEAFEDQGAEAFEVLCNDKLLIEGFDAPQAAVCLNLAPTLSRVRAQQRGGRVLRLDSDNPHKHAYIVDFIDKDYRTPPVLFSDPKVAEEAQIGNSNHSIFMNQDTVYISEKARLVTRPSNVQAIAHYFAERRKGERRLPPEGWLSIGQVCALYGINESTARKELGVLSERYSDQSGEFHDPKIKSRSTRRYFGQQIVYDFVESRSLQYVDFKRVFPERWTTREEFARHYSPRVLKSMFYSVQLLHADMLSSHTVTNLGTEFLSPEAQKALHNGSRPNGIWRTVEDLCTASNMSETDIEELCPTISQKAGLTVGIRPCWWLVDGKEIMMYHP